jgi:myosin heavy subunit
MMVHLDRVLAQSEHYVSNAKGRQDLKFHLEFEIKHFAGTVRYSIDGFNDKNKVRSEIIKQTLSVYLSEL